jgi:3-phenylpropionate/cinnamic acid dioxygenase small subunit
LLVNSEQQHEIEQFFYQEALLLDDHKYVEWLDLFSEDTHYWMPIRQTKTSDELDEEFGKPGDVAYYDDPKAMLEARVRRLETGYAWAEDPPSRTRHCISNVIVTGIEGDEISTTSNFILYRSRLERDVDWWVGRRLDVLRRHEGSFLIAKRTVLLDMTNILSRNLSNFF